MCVNLNFKTLLFYSSLIPSPYSGTRKEQLSLLVAINRDLFVLKEKWRQCCIQCIGKDKKSWRLYSLYFLHKSLTTALVYKILICGLSVAFAYTVKYLHAIAKSVAQEPIG